MFSSVKETMHYCPKCQQSYEDQAQRFCLSDGERLVPTSNAAKSTGKMSGVFTNLIGKATPIGKTEDDLASIPRFIKPEAPAAPLSELQTINETTQTFDAIELELEIAPVYAVRDDSAFELELDELQAHAKTTRIVDPREVPSGTAEVGDRKINPTGRKAFSRENPGVLIGQSVKNRYRLIKLLGEDETSISYLAEDKINAPKKNLVRVLMDEDPDEVAGSFFAEERVALSHVNHPNIARVVDSGELPEGKPFIVSEFIEAASIRTLVEKSGQVNAMRAARIVRQAAYALSEAHESAILHRDLKPENVLLTISESGAEQVKLINFGTSGAKLHKGNLAYKAPEILDGKPPTFSGDIFSLAVIAYQMLTNRLPFHGAGEKALHKAQRQGLLLLPTNLRLDVPPEIDKILEKALAFNPNERFPKARDFGDAFFNTLSGASQPFDGEESSQTEKNDLLKAYDEPELLTLDAPSVSPAAENAEAQILDLTGGTTETTQIKLKAESQPEENDRSALISVADDAVDAGRAKDKPPETSKTVETNQTKASEDLWARRSPELPAAASRNRILFSLIGLAALFAAVWAIWAYSLEQPDVEPYVAQSQNDGQTETSPVAGSSIPTQSDLPQAKDAEAQPASPRISQPPGSIYFQNSRQNLKGDMLRNYLPFSLYFPKDWQVNPVNESAKPGARGKFLDISKNAPSGNLSDQILVSYYDSRGLYKDDAEIFPRLVEETNKTLQKLIPNYQALSEGETVVNGWKAYEVKFQGGGETPSGEKMIVWGRRLFIPAVMSGIKSGYEITLLSTSFSPEVKSVDDVGTKGELAAVLETFEPDKNF
jgi:serine/threonine protein kinase